MSGDTVMIMMINKIRKEETFMKNKGYTIIEAVIAMFLVVTMVGAVFSALMSGSRAIISSTDKEEVLYTMQSTYSMLKDCRDNENCLLRDLGAECINNQLENCDALFTYNFQNICKDGNGNLSYSVKGIEGPTHTVSFYQTTAQNVTFKDMFEILDIESSCNE